MNEISLYPMDVDSHDFNYINDKNSIYLLDCRITESIDFLEYDLELSQNIINKHKTDSSVCSLGSIKSILVDMEDFDIDEFGFTLDDIGSGIHDVYLGEAISEFNKKIIDLKESRICVIDEFYIHTEFKNKGIGSKALSDFLYTLKHVYYVDYVFLYFVY